MIGTLDQERMRSTTSAPSMSGRPRSTMKRSTGRSVAARSASAPAEASSTVKPLSSKPVRRKRRICTSSSTTSTIGEGSLICVTFQLRHRSLRHWELDCHQGAAARPLALGLDAARIGGDERARDPKPEPGAADRARVPLAAREPTPHARLIGFREARAMIADAQYETPILTADLYSDLRTGRRI